MKQKKMKDATRPLNFKITKQHVKAAKCGDPEQCVIAQAVRDALPDHVAEIHVGSCITKIVNHGGLVVRYQTPVALARALRDFDKKKGWSLPEGDYHLGPPAPTLQLSGKRGKFRTYTPKKVPTGKGWTPFKGRAVPTRHVVSVHTIAAR